jgi:translocation and assembly module TamA
VSDFNFSLRHSVGVGLRYSSGFGLLRIDLAVPLNRRPEDARYQFWFGFGQIF